MRRLALALAFLPLSGCGLAPAGMLAFPVVAETRLSEPLGSAFTVTEVKLDPTRIFYEFGIVGFREEFPAYDSQTGGMSNWFKSKIEARVRSAGVVGGDEAPIDVVVHVNEYSETETVTWLRIFPTIIPTLGFSALFGCPVSAMDAKVDVVFSVTSGSFQKDYPLTHHSSRFYGFYYGYDHWPGTVMAPLVDEFVAALSRDLLSEE